MSVEIITPLAGESVNPLEDFVLPFIVFIPGLTIPGPYEVETIGDLFLFRHLGISNFVSAGREWQFNSGREQRILRSKTVDSFPWDSF